MFVALDGIDASGKGTVITRLLKEHAPAMVITCPNRDSPTGAIISRFLTDRDSCPRMMQVAMFEANRWELVPVIRRALSSNVNVFANRWCPSGLAYALASGPEYFDAAKMLNRGLPEPDRTIIMDITPAESFLRKPKRDAFEADADLLQAAREAFLHLSKEFGWKVINAMGPPDEVLQLVREALR